MASIQNYMKKCIALFIPLIFMASSCSLDIEGTDSIITPESGGTFQGVENPSAQLTEIFNAIRGNLEAQDNYFALQEVSTDELLVPTRGTDWGDNGIWRTLHAHTWTPAHQYVLNVWNQFNQEILRSTEVIDTRSQATAADVAQARFTRAYSMFIIMDNYGQVPFREPDDAASVNPSVLSRTEAYDMIISDLTSAMSDLPANGPGVGGDRATQASANFLMAKVRLNAPIYNGSGTANAADMQAVIDAVDAIEAAGFALEAGYFNLFTSMPDNETIFWVPASTGNNMWNGLHYHQIASDNQGGGWNGFTTLSEFYDLFEGDPNTNAAGSGQEERRGWVPDGTNSDNTNIGIGFGFLVGQQWGATGFDDSGNPTGFTALNDRPGNPLVFTRELPGLVGNNERTGIRVLKYHPVNGAFAGHKIIFRYSDAHLMRAEAMWRMGGDPTAEVNELRAIRGATPLASTAESDLIDERGRELYIEYWRRNDLIRFGQFTKNWPFKDGGSVGDETKNLYPIPSNALLSNPNLTQNPGY